MVNQQRWMALVWKTWLALLICAGLVTVCYFLIDRPVSYFVYEHRWNRFYFLKWLTFIPPFVQTWSPLVIAACVLRPLSKPRSQCELALLAACVSVILAHQFKESLAVLFGRAWPETWVNNNPSLIGDGTFGFHFFRGNVEYASFPSGHMARLGAAMAVLWIAAPKLRWLALLVLVAEAIGLVGMNYHFVGDVIAGTIIGGIIGSYTAYGFGVEPAEFDASISANGGESRREPQ